MSLRLYSNSRWTNVHDSGHKVYLDVPFEMKDEVKQKGAMWDPDAKRWYATEYMNLEQFEPWRIRHLNVPYEEKNEAKAAGARWDPRASKWYIPYGYNSHLFTKWIPQAALAIEDGTSVADNPNDLLVLDSQELNRQKRVIFFDIETNGLPPHPIPLYHSLTDFDCCRIVEISWLLCDRDTLNALEPVQEVIIKSDGFPIDNAQFHGITLEKSLEEGVAFPGAVQKFMHDLKLASQLIAHNAEFDVTIFKSELYRYQMNDVLQYMNKDIEPVCTMWKLRDVIGLLNKNGDPKIPSLKELYRFSMEEEMDNHHQAKHDVLNLHKAVKRLVERGVVSF